MTPSTGSSADDQNPALQMIKITGVDAKKRTPSISARGFVKSI